MNWIKMTPIMLLISLCLELYLIIFLVPTSWVDKVIAKENYSMYQMYGADTNQWLNERSRSMYHTAFVSTGFTGLMRDTILLTEDEYERSGAMKDLGSKTVWIYVADRFEAAYKMGHQLTKRIAVIWAFTPMMLLLLIPCAWDGYMSWRIRVLSFNYASTWLQKQASLIFKAGAIILLLFLLAPISIPAHLPPIIMLISTPLLGLLVVANIPKKI